MKKLLLMLALGLLMIPGSALVLAQDGPAAGLEPIENCTISFLTVWSGEDELPNWEHMVQPFVDATGCNIEVESTRDIVPVLTTRVEAGNPPDIAGVPSFGAISTFLERGQVVPLDFLDQARLAEQFGDVWMELGTVDGTLYGVLPRAAIKSLVWYSPKAFEAAGYEVPTTWDELLNLCGQIVDDGAACFSIGLESGAASGWPATDWLEDIMLRTNSLETYDGWVDGSVAWTSDEVTRAWETFGDIVGEPDFQFGGPQGTLATNFGTAPCPLFTNPPGAYLHRQASFIQSFIMDCPGGENLVPGEDFDFFLFPPIDEAYGTPALGSADMFAMFNDTPGARALMDYLTQPEALAGWLEGGGSGIATNNQFPMDLYPDVLTRRAAQVLQEATAFRFDASDLMPGDVNQAFWSGTLDFVQNPDNLETILQTIQDVADSAYGSTATQEASSERHPIHSPAGQEPACLACRINPARCVLDTQEAKWRSLLFTGPAILLLFVLLVYPTLDTIRLSFMDQLGQQFVGLDNYRYAVTSPRMQEAFRNNLLWLFVFTAGTVGFGLLVAVLTDRVKYEALAKSVIFLPMAISFVGAGVIWKFVYDLKPPGTPLQPGQQIGLLNALVTSANPDRTLSDAIAALNNEGVPVERQAAVDAIIAVESPALDAAVEGGTLTEAQAERLQARLPDAASAYLNGDLPSYREPWQALGQWPQVAVRTINDAISGMPAGSGAVICKVVPYSCTNAITGAEEDALNAAVDEGRLTRDRADEIEKLIPAAAASFLATGQLPSDEGWQTTSQWGEIVASVDSVSVRGLNTTLDTGAQPIDWIRTPLINNLALIIVGVWIWTGFCTVILSAALKNIPAELFEAARVDGANEFQIFFRITIPQLMPTLTVVTTTMLITVLKVFDIVYVMTAGNFGTEVIANRMYQEMYGGQRQFGHASAIAVILMLAIVPVMILNVQQFRKQEAQR